MEKKCCRKSETSGDGQHGKQLKHQKICNTSDICRLIKLALHSLLTIRWMKRNNGNSLSKASSLHASRKRGKKGSITSLQQKCQSVCHEAMDGFLKIHSKSWHRLIKQSQYTEYPLSDSWPLRKRSSTKDPKPQVSIICAIWRITFTMLGVAQILT